MKKLIFCLLVIFSYCAQAQQEESKPISLSDSLKQIMQFKLQEQNQVFNSLKTEIQLPDIRLPEIDFNSAIAMRWNLNPGGIGFRNFKSLNFSPDFSFMPFNQSILSSSAYKLGDKLLVGGYSYGVNSVFMPPHLNQPFNKFDIYGSSLFFQYNVSKNLKIGASVNVNNRPVMVY